MHIFTPSENSLRSQDKLLELVFVQSTSIGVRIIPLARAALHRRFEVVATPFGEVRVKVTNCC